jgi:hypothetical protein
MPINALRKDIPRGTAPPRSQTGDQESATFKLTEKEERDRDLAAKELEELWDQQEGEGKVSWSGEGGSRYSDYGS